MATRVYREVDITLQDDTDITLRPLPIGQLRRFMEAWKGLSTITDENDDGFWVFINCSGIALEWQLKGKFDTTRCTESQAKKGEFLSEPYKNYLEGVLDLDTIYEIIDVCAGINLKDPKLMESLAEAAEAQD